jgi:cyclophilin family peptidyl-prolyl cis-trans isomerase
LSIIVLCQADESYRVKFDVTLKSKTTASFIVEVHPDWAPLGAARFKELVHAEFFKSVRFFRVIDGFMAQFGIHGKPAIAAEWKEKTLMDDPVKESNKPGECIVVLIQSIEANAARFFAPGYISFATSGKDSRTTQVFLLRPCPSRPYRPSFPLS